MTHLSEEDLCVGSNMSGRRTIYEEEKMFTCDICKMNFSTDIGLSVHLHNNCVQNLCETDENDSTKVVLHDQTRASIMPLKNKFYTRKVSSMSNRPTIYKDEKQFTRDICKMDSEADVSLSIHLSNNCGRNLCETNKKDTAKIVLPDETQSNITTLKNTFFTQKIEQTCDVGVHPGEKTFVCNICQEGFCKKASLDKHYVIHSAKKSHLCELCNKSFSTKYNLVAHSKVHTKEKLCVQKSDSLKQQQDHVIKQFVCDVCNKSFIRKCNLIQHTTRVHSKCNPKYVCNVCLMAFKCNRSLTNHRRNHTSIKTHVCNICLKAFRDTSDLRLHYRTHTGEKPFSCDICRRAFTDTSSLRKHLRTHTGEKPYVCDICQKAFSQSGILREHYCTHTGEKPFACNICAKTFTLKKSLYRHNAIHEERLYACDMCPKTFTRKDHLSAHLKIHNKKVEEECNKKFALI